MLSSSAIMAKPRLKRTVSPSVKEKLWSIFKDNRGKDTTQQSLKQSRELTCRTSELHTPQAIQNIDMKEINHRKREQVES